MSQADDRILEDLLRRRREDARPAGGPLCGDPELLAAFTEDALTGSARADMERHLSECAACQEAVARLVRLAPRPVLETPRPQVAWWKRWVWAAPALAGVVLVGSFVMFNRGRIVESPSMTAQLPAPPPKAPVAEPQPAEPTQIGAAAAKPAGRGAKPGQDEARVAGPAAGSSVAVAAPVEKDKLAEAKTDPDLQKSQKEEEQAAKFREGARDQVKAQAQALPAPAPPQQQTQVFAKAPADTAQRADQVRGAGPAGQMVRLPQSEKVAAETAAAEPMVSNVRADDRRKEGKKLGLFLSSDAKTARTVRAKDARQVWTLLTDGRLLLSLDAGATWKEVAVPERPRDVTAPDANTAEITTVSGRVYRTTDSGASWVLAPPR